MMKLSVGFIMAAALLIGCGGSPPVGTNGIALEPASQPPVVAPAVPDAKGRDLLYVSNGNSAYIGKVFVYTYPKARKIGTLPIVDSARGLCLDKAGDVFVTFDGED